MYLAICMYACMEGYLSIFMTLSSGANLSISSETTTTSSDESTETTSSPSVPGDDDGILCAQYTRCGLGCGRCVNFTTVPIELYS